MATIIEEVGLSAAWNVRYDIDLYQWYALTGQPTESTDRSSVRGIGTAEISAGATVVGALCGVMGLTGKQKDPGEMEVQIINKTPYCLVPATVNSYSFGFQETPRLMAPGDSSSVKGYRDDGFDVGSSGVGLTLLIGNSAASSIEVYIDVKLTQEEKWQILWYKIDNGSNCRFTDEDGEKLQYVGYRAQNTSMPSFSFNLLPIRKSSGGKVNLVFLPTYNIPW